MHYKRIACEFRLSCTSEGCYSYHLFFVYRGLELPQTLIWIRYTYPLAIFLQLSILLYTLYTFLIKVHHTIISVPLSAGAGLFFSCNTCSHHAARSEMVSPP